MRDCVGAIKIRKLDRNKICFINTTTINIKNQSSSKVRKRKQKMKEQEWLEPVEILMQRYSFSLWL